MKKKTKRLGLINIASLGALLDRMPSGWMKRSEGAFKDKRFSRWFWEELAPLCRNSREMIVMFHSTLMVLYRADPALRGDAAISQRLSVLDRFEAEQGPFDADTYSLLQRMRKRTEKV